MSRFPSLTLADNAENRVHELADGFERLGSQDTPFTLRKGEDKRQRAQQLHSERETSIRERDEESNEPITRTLQEWRADMMGRDFPFVDTIPLAEQRSRADHMF
jgi:hypothetical protein